MSSIIDWVILTHLFYGVGASIPGRSSILGAPEALARVIVRFPRESDQGYPTPGKGARQGAERETDKWWVLEV